jgi:hypothetical protein
VEPLQQTAEGGLSSLLNNERFREFFGSIIRTTSHTPPMISILDLLQSLYKNPSDCLRCLKSIIASDLRWTNETYRFKGQTRSSPVTNAKGVVIILSLLPGSRVSRFRAACADVIVRYLGGDKTLVEETKANNTIVESLLPDDLLNLIQGYEITAGDPGQVATSLEGCLSSDIQKKEGELCTLQFLQ